MKPADAGEGVEREDERVAEQDLEHARQRSGASVTPGIESGVGSGRATDEMSQTTPSSAMATATPPPIQLRSTGHGSPFQRASVPRVWRAPRTSTYWFTSTA